VCALRNWTHDKARFERSKHGNMDTKQACIGRGVVRVNVNVNMAKSQTKV